jgi:hypothetical protein
MPEVSDSAMDKIQNASGNPSKNKEQTFENFDA